MPRVRAGKGVYATNVGRAVREDPTGVIGWLKGVQNGPIGENGTWVRHNMFSEPFGGAYHALQQTTLDRLEEHV